MRLSVRDTELLFVMTHRADVRAVHGGHNAEAPLDVAGHFIAAPMPLAPDKSRPAFHSVGVVTAQGSAQKRSAHLQLF
jgi:hypothetical protein